MDVMKRAKATYRDENNSILFVQDDAWEILRAHSKWDAPEPIDLTEGDVPGVDNEDLFGEDARPRPVGPDKSKSYVERVSSQTGSRQKGVRGLQKERSYAYAFGGDEISRNEDE
ncbi:hypothetical protein Tco_0896440 [Tanacetum coccineum]